MVDLYDDFYGDKPLFLATLLTQEMRYNALLDQIDALEDEGRICVIRPDEPVGIGRFEGSTEKRRNSTSAVTRKCSKNWTV